MVNIKKKLFSKSSSRHGQVDVKPLISQIPNSINHLYYKYHSNGKMNTYPCVIFLMGSLCIQCDANVHIKWSKTFYEMLRHIKVVQRSRLIYSIKKTLMCAVTYVARFRNKNLYTSIKNDDMRKLNLKWWWSCTNMDLATRHSRSRILWFGNDEITCTKKNGFTATVAN